MSYVSVIEFQIEMVISQFEPHNKILKQKSTSNMFQKYTQTW